MDECFAREAEWREQRGSICIWIVSSAQLLLRLGFCAYIRRAWLGFELRASSVEDASATDSEAKRAMGHVMSVNAIKGIELGFAV